MFLNTSPPPPFLFTSSQPLPGCGGAPVFVGPICEFVVCLASAEGGDNLQTGGEKEREKVCVCGRGEGLQEWAICSHRHKSPRVCAHLLSLRTYSLHTAAPPPPSSIHNYSICRLWPRHEHTHTHTQYRVNWDLSITDRWSLLVTQLIG